MDPAPDPRRPDRIVLCPICRRPVGTLRGPHTREFPFCSQRCREQDLANWAGGKYVIPGPIPPEVPPED